MLFYESAFLFAFLPLAVLGHWALPRSLRNGWLFFASLLFYAASSLQFLPLLVGSVTVDYWLGRAIFTARTPGARRAWLGCSVLLNLGLLAVFKYAGLITRSLGSILGSDLVPTIELPLPVGISFYTFQSLSYTIDLYRGRAHPARSFIDFGAFVTLFPQLIAGPIVRYDELERELAARTATAERFALGARMFVMGLAKKILVADTAAALADPLFALEAPGTAQAWAAVLLYSFQIYFDFSGYSDMAVGLGRLVGFEFPQNFNSPYKAASLSEFWRRWHITLSTWLRDNLYVPLGGNRKGAARTQVNLLLTMFLGGLWHGAGWNYALWGLYHGILLVLERACARFVPVGPVPRAARVAVVFVLVCLGWVLFRLPTLDAALVWYGALLGWNGLAGGVPTLPWFCCVALLALVWGVRSSWELKPGLGLVENALLAVGLLVCALVAYGKGSSPFLYFQF